MTDSTARLALPYILTGQAQKEVTHNEALNRLDAAVQLAVLDRNLTEPPASPAEASAYLVAAGASGLWLGRDGQIAAYYGGWQFLTPRHGWQAWVIDEDLLLRHMGGGWVVFASNVGQSLMAAQDVASARLLLGLGAAAMLAAGSAAGNLVQLDGAAKLPAVDGSQLLNLPSGGGAMSLDGLTDVDTSATPPSDGQALVWHDADGLWRPGTVSGSGTTGGLVMLLASLGDGNATTFTLAQAAAGTVLAFVGGLLQSNAMVTETFLSFDAAPPSGAAVVAYTCGGDPVLLLATSGDGTTSGFTLSTPPSGDVACFVGGTLQTNTTRSGIALSFDTPPPSGATVIVFG